MSNSVEIARTLLWEHFNDAAKARQYADRIAAVNGPLSADYADAARLLLSQEPRFSQQDAETMFRALKDIIAHPRCTYESRLTAECAIKFVEDRE